MKYSRIVYISHPYGGKRENRHAVADLFRKLQEQHPDTLFLSPIHAFSPIYHTVLYQDGLNRCLWLLDRCTEMWVFGDYQNSVGCMAEIEHCRQNDIPFYIFSEGGRYGKESN